MAIKLRNTILLLIFLPCVMYLLNPVIFDFLVYLSVLYVCGKSLLRLFMYNFATAEELDKYEASFKPLTVAEMIFRKIANVIVTVLFTVFFIGKGIYITGIIKYAALLVAALWMFDLLKTVFSYVSVWSADEDYSIWDVFLEGIMWVQNILSVVVVMALLLS